MPKFRPSCKRCISNIKSETKIENSVYRSLLKCGIKVFKAKWTESALEALELKAKYGAMENSLKRRNIKNIGLINRNRKLIYDVMHLYNIRNLKIALPVA